MEISKYVLDIFGGEGGRKKRFVLIVLLLYNDALWMTALDLFCKHLSLTGLPSN